MEADLMHNVHSQAEEEYVLLDLDAVSGQVDIPPDAPYVSFEFSEAPPVLHEETGPSEATLFSGKYIIDPNQAPSKQPL
ncbi:hypothetical protein P3X46_006821 [Hevea brasiliensis]|uniref:Transcription factor TFIIIC triple barrel domain-containing protein n=1 Tax=Hevea brasiliensis TaxID=3981 RepID=A0ABQ9MRV8_HEVBR|nr:hypothetical protein P3X46_006821 [Hevea brasiliensis]